MPAKARKLAQLFGLPSVSPYEKDHELMLRVSRGDAKAFRELYEKYKGPIMSYAMTLLRDQAVAAEVTQEVFLRVYRTRESYTRESRFTTWLWTIARNLAIDHLRKKSEWLAGEDLESFADAVSDREMDPNAEAILVQKAERERLERCLGRLPAAQREAISLRTFSELSHEEIAAQLQATIAAVKSLLHRAKAGLLACLEGGAS